jgi:hypothetical protein
MSPMPARTVPPLSAISVASALVDVATVAAVAVLCGLAIPDAPAAAALSGGLATLIALVAWRWTLGGSVGHALLGLRTVWRPAGMPAAPWRSPRETIRVRDGADPLTLAPAPVSLSAEPEAEDGVEPRRLDRLRIVVDDGTVHTVQHAAVVGRDPTVPRDPRQALVAIPDLTRTISRSHVLLEVTADGVHVTDLGSANGTRLLPSPVPLPPHAAVLAPWGTTLALGERTITLDRRAPLGEFA